MATGKGSKADEDERRYKGRCRHYLDYYEYCIVGVEDA